MHDDATLLAAFGLASFALVAALIPLVGDLGRRRAFGVRTGGFQRRRTLPLLLLVVEVGAACALFAAGIRVHLVNDDADLGLTVAWLVAMAGAFRVLVNVEGAAAVVASGAAIAVTVTASLQGQTMLADVAAILAGAGAAALLCSWHPARLRLTATGAVLLGFVFGSLALELRYPKNQPDGVSAVALVAAAPLFFAALLVLDSWRRRRPLRVALDQRLGAASPAIVVAMLGMATAILAAAGVAVARDAAPAWVGYPAACTGAFLLLGCLAALERRPSEQHSVFAGGEQRRQLELLPASNVTPAAMTSLQTKWARADEETAWARAKDKTETFYFRSLADPDEDSVGVTATEATIEALDAELPTGADNLSFHWPPGSGGGGGAPSEQTPPPIEDPEPIPRRPDFSVYLDEQEQASADDEHQPADVEELHADMRDLVRMARTMLDALAGQIEQNEESARMVTGHLGSTESQLANVAEQLGTLADSLAQPSPAPDDANGDGHASGPVDDNGYAPSLRRVEARLQQLVDDMRAIRVPDRFEGTVRRLRDRVRPRRDK